MELRVLRFVATALVLALGLGGCAATEVLRDGLQSGGQEDTDDQLGQLRVFRALDVDDDGHISAREMEAAPESLASLDDNGDGRLSGKEFGPRRPRVMLVSPEELPAGTKIVTRRVAGGNTIDVAGLPPEVQSILSSADVDGDGTASAGELVAMMAAQDGEPSGERNSHVHDPLVVTLDTDGDGTVSRTEIESAGESLRERDSDGNGVISPRELRRGSNRE